MQTKSATSFLLFSFGFDPSYCTPRLCHFFLFGMSIRCCHSLSHVVTVTDHTNDLQSVHVSCVASNLACQLRRYAAFMLSTAPAQVYESRHMCYINVCVGTYHSSHSSHIAVLHNYPPQIVSYCDTSFFGVVIPGCYNSPAKYMLLSSMRLKSMSSIQPRSAQ